MQLRDCCGLGITSIELYEDLIRQSQINCPKSQVKLSPRLNFEKSQFLLLTLDIDRVANIVVGDHTYPMGGIMESSQHGVQR